MFCGAGRLSSHFGSSFSLQQLRRADIRASGRCEEIRVKRSRTGKLRKWVQISAKFPFRIPTEILTTISQPRHYAGWIKLPASTEDLPYSGPFNSISQSEGRIVDSLAKSLMPPSYGYLRPQPGHVSYLLVEAYK